MRSLYCFGFIIEQALGHITHGQNLQLIVAMDYEIEGYWGFPAWTNNGSVGKIPVLKNNWTIHAGLKTRRILAEMQQRAHPEVLFFHTQVPAILSQDWLSRIPSIISLDATPKQYDRLGDYYAHKTGPAWLENVKLWMNRSCFHRARHLVTWSHWAKQGLVEEYAVPAGKVTVIPPGVEIHAWQTTRQTRSPGEKVKVLFVGGDLKRKGGLVLLEAFRSLANRVTVSPDGEKHILGIELHLVTRDHLPEEPGLHIYNDLNPNSPALKQLYQECDIFCLPTLGDCLPMVLSEAGAAGLPLVSTCLAGIPEIVEDGHSGFLVPPGDSASLTAVLERLIMDPQLRLYMGENAKQAIIRDFDARKNAHRLVELLKEIADEERLNKRLS